MKKLISALYLSFMCFGFAVAPAMAQLSAPSAASLSITSGVPTVLGFLQATVPADLKTGLDKLFGIVEGVVQYILGKRYAIAGFALVVAATGWAFFGRRQGSEWMKGAIIIALLIGLLPMIIGMFVNLAPVVGPGTAPGN